MQDALRTLIAALETYRAAEGETTPRVELRKPATQRDLARIERHWGIALPPSYRALLELHDGARGLKYPAHLLSCADILAEGSASRVARFIRGWKKTEELDRALVIGLVDAATNWVLYLDGACAPNAAGELPVVEWEPSGSTRHRDLAAFLREQTKTWTVKRPTPSRRGNERPSLPQQRAEAVAVTGDAIALLTIASDSDPGALSIWSLDGQRLRTLIADIPYSGADGLSFSFDGKHLAYVRDGAAHLVDVAKGQEQILEAGSVTSLAFRPDGGIVLAADSKIRLFEGPRFRERKLSLAAIDRAVGPPADLRGTASGFLLVEGAGCDRRAVCDANLEPVLVLPASRANGASLRADGRQIVTALATGAIEVRSVPDGEILWGFETSSMVWCEPRLSPDGAHVVAVGRDAKKAPALAVWDASGRELLRERCPVTRSSMRLRLALTPSGSHAVAVLHGRVLVVPLPARAEI
ncbi:MAG: SMI1/KNR4 family protein [Deltaproteobacteria bacterium]|nr:SMI1/KNR4 family protein [Deltaproteobacteria bacterium]